MGCRYRTKTSRHEDFERNWLWVKNGHLIHTASVIRNRSSTKCPAVPVGVEDTRKPCEPPSNASKT